MEKTLYFIRHGETEFNRLGYVQGSGVNSELNAFGRAQAFAFFQAYKHIPFDKVYTSALVRTHQSVAGFLEKGLPWEILEGLNEISWGRSEGKPPSPETDQMYFDTLRRWRLGETTLGVNGGESPEQVQARQKPVMDLILSRAEEKNVLVCLHGRALRILLCHLLQRPLSDMDTFEHRNLCLYQLTWDGHSFAVVKANDTQHLHGLVSPEPLHRHNQAHKPG